MDDHAGELARIAEPPGREPVRDEADELVVPARSAMSVANAPGITQLTRTCGAYSWAKARVSALSPFFDAAYVASGGLGRSAPMLEMLMIDPLPARNMWRLPRPSGGTGP